MKLPSLITALVLASGSALVACAAQDLRAPVYSVRVVNTFPHDPNAFTQGLIFEDGVLYEGTGLEGQSELRKVDLKTGKVLQRLALPTNVFGEGLTSFAGQLVQLTWTTGVGYVYDKASFRRIRTFNYATEGWGLTHDGKSLILSDGSSRLYFLDPSTYRVQRTVNVTADGQNVVRLNELEFVGGQVLANVWLTNRIARIDPKSGKVSAWYDLTDIVNRVPDRGPDDVLNGIAYDAKGGRLFITGKRWPALYEVKLGGR
ncbi:glutaminyl-peptide cyclotransferase [Deinococcus peraridilitoris]|uniref:glutaminyl-peptide cyclotransferase n=1 Tax=Deinococcus peraridilitoris TaxID=432329 RepID=UPI000306814C|nr:glutaminyl-peptide cyclotransferase [Deinococcus peraridilitoris]